MQDIPGVFFFLLQILSLPSDGSGSFLGGGMGGCGGERVTQSAASCFSFILFLSLALFIFFSLAPPSFLPGDISYSSHFVAQGNLGVGRRMLLSDSRSSGGTQ